MGEAYSPTDLRPCPAMSFRDHVDQVLGMVRLRVPFVRAEVGAVLETRLGDHASTCEVLVGPEAEVEVRLDLLRFFRQASEPDRSVRVRITDLRESALQEERGLQQAELQPTSDHLAEEPGLMEGTPLASSITTARSPRKCTTTRSL